MRKFNWLLVFTAIACLQGCAVIGGIFKAGVVVGIFVVVVVIALIIWLISALRSK